MMKTTAKFAALATGALSIGSLAVSAATWSPTITPLSYTDGVFPALAASMPGFSVPGFHVSNNPVLAGATLTGVSYDIYLTMRDVEGPGLNTNAKLVNGTAVPQSVQEFKVRGTIFLDVPGIAGVSNEQLDAIWEDPLTIGFDSRSMSGNEVVSFDITQSNTDLNPNVTTAGLLAAVQVAGSVAWDVYGESGSTITQSGSAITASISPVADYRLEVTYHYTPASTEVPEASTVVAMVPLAAFGAWMVRRRSKVSAKA